MDETWDLGNYQMRLNPYLLRALNVSAVQSTGQWLR
jgi:hypothetical protein